MNPALNRRPCHSRLDVRGVHRTGVSRAANVMPKAEEQTRDNESSSGGKVNLTAEDELMEEGHAHTTREWVAGELAGALGLEPRYSDSKSEGPTLDDIPKEIGWETRGRT